VKWRDDPEEGDLLVAEAAGKGKDVGVSLNPKTFRIASRIVPWQATAHAERQ
jgi:hypothetical protein